MKTIKYLIGCMLATVTLCSNAAEGSRPFFERSLPTVAKYAGAKLFDAFGASSCMHRFNIYLGQKFPYEHDTTALASAEFQKLGKETQDLLEIPQERQVSIKKMPTTDQRYVEEPEKVPPSESYCPCFCTSEGIFINENAFVKALSFGQKRTHLLHEGVHRKYHDEATKFFISKIAPPAIAIVIIPFPTTFLVDAFFTSRKMKYPFLAACAISSSLTLLTSIAYDNSSLPEFISSNMAVYRERRADTIAARAAACAVCVREFANGRSPEPYPQGYLCSIELHHIADEHEQKGKYCEYHTYSTDIVACACDTTPAVPTKESYGYYRPSRKRRPLLRIPRQHNKDHNENN